MSDSGAVHAFGDRQQQLLRHLLREKAGLTVDELAEALSITRTAVAQHLAALERDGYVAKGEARKTAGRPRHVYVLTARGFDLFPKQYSWFSSLLLKVIKGEKGSKGLSRAMREIAADVASPLEQKLAGLPEDKRLEEIVSVMNGLAFDASKKAGEPVIEASNCVYHHLAAENPEVCDFDIELLKRLSGASVDHQECIIRGGNVCRFRFGAKKKADKP